jgi:hypothetical protein
MNPPLPFRAQNLHGENRVGFGEPKPADYEIELLLKLKAGYRVTLLGNRGARTPTRLARNDASGCRQKQQRSVSESVASWRCGAPSPTLTPLSAAAVIDYDSTARIMRREPEPSP